MQVSSSSGVLLPYGARLPVRPCCSHRFFVFFLLALFFPVFSSACSSSRCPSPHLDPHSTSFTRFLPYVRLSLSLSLALSLPPLLSSFSICLSLSLLASFCRSPFVFGGRPRYLLPAATAAKLKARTRVYTFCVRFLHRALQCARMYALYCPRDSLPADPPAA